MHSSSVLASRRSHFQNVALNKFFCKKNCKQIKMNDNVEIIRSNKGGMKIIHRGYMYTVHKRRQGGGIRWRCTQRSLHCKGSISTGNGPPSVNMPHNHIPDPHSVALARCRQLEEFPDINSLLETEYEEIKDSMPLQQRMLLSAPPQVQIPSTSEPLLQSQPLSPTKLKVTRQVSKQQNLTPKLSETVSEEVCLRWNSHHSNMQTTFPQLLEKEQYVDVTIIAEDKTLKCHRVLRKRSKIEHPIQGSSNPFNNLVNTFKTFSTLRDFYFKHFLSVVRVCYLPWFRKKKITFGCCIPCTATNATNMILSSCSTYFEEILNDITPLQHPVIILKGTPFWILKALIDFMYAGEINIDQNKLPELLDVAELLKVKGLAGKSNSSDQNNKQENQPSKKPAPKENARPSQTAKNPPQLSPVAKVEDMPISDPLDLLEPKFHEELERTSPKSKESKLPSKKPLAKKLRKRKSSEDEPVSFKNVPLFPMRRGTRSRPNVKIPKYYDYEDIVKPTAPDIQPFSPVMNIKSEPLDVEEGDSFNNSNTDVENENSSMEITCINPKSLEKNPISKDSPICIKSISVNNEEKIKPTYRIKIKSFSSLSEQAKTKIPDDEEEIDFQKTSATISLVVHPSSNIEKVELEKPMLEDTNSVQTKPVEKDPLEDTNPEELTSEETPSESQETQK